MTGAADAPTVVTGARGRLGRALMARLVSAGRPAVAWDRPEYDLDSAGAAAPLLARDRPRSRDPLRRLDGRRWLRA